MDKNNRWEKPFDIEIAGLPSTYAKLQLSSIEGEILRQSYHRSSAHEGIQDAGQGQTSIRLASAQDPSSLFSSNLGRNGPRPL